MKKNVKRIMTMALAASMGLGLAACGSSDGTAAATKAAASSGSSGSTTGAASSNFTYPMASGNSVSYWVAMTSTVSANYANLGDTPFAKGLMKNTGIDVEFLQPAQGQEKEQFSLLVADGNLPDIMEYNWVTDYPGGPQKAIDDQVILPLNDVIDKYCPNLKKYLQEHPDIDQAVKTDDGTYYCFPFIRDEQCRNTIGLMLRQDWLDDLGMDVPETIDEWHDVLTAFKTKEGASAPFTFEYTNSQYLQANPILYAFNTSYSYYLGSDDKIHFGAIDDGYRDYLKTMHQWYTEGLVDPDLATMKNDQVAAKMTHGDAGVSIGQAGSRMGTWMSAATQDNPDYLLVAAPQPSLTKGQKNEFGHVEIAYSGRASAAITTSCKDVERAARLLDYAYSDEGHMYYNFGTEGVSYNMVDGNPVYTDLILKNPDGLPISQAMSAYIRGNYNGPFEQDGRYLDQYYTLDCQKETVNVWGSGSSNGAKHQVPAITPTADESKEFATIMNQIETYRDEMTLKFMFGDEDIDTGWDTYVKTIKDMGIDRAEEIENAAYTRYKNR